ncbi:MAG: hypothetical protein AVDCRST_MAG59-2899 [uncultured Thermomicrobiales bacterium]|uniref:Uncharacterized protein n=1 Tax=uncultured Thermomicrobiales bacterium TaxID=1645740 RepID=A0A6J4V3Z4_9BACT|nr:MAG: hypothetical protein AVDCRST_MAG59-2899 [uncultured Thermomicrobiales bacterium]
MPRAKERAGGPGPASRRIPSIRLMRHPRRLARPAAVCHHSD